MKTQLFSFISLTTLLFACSSLKTHSDYEKGTDFSSYKTFKIVEIDNEKAGIDEINLNRIIKAVKNELLTKGMSEADEADVELHLHALIEKEISASASTDYYTTYYRRGYARYRYNGIGYASTTIDVDEYKVGTLIIDIVDRKENKLVWQGLGSGTLSEKPKNREERIKNAITKILTSYPPGN